MQRSIEIEGYSRQRIETKEYRDLDLIVVGVPIVSEELSGRLSAHLGTSSVPVLRSRIHGIIVIMADLRTGHAECLAVLYYSKMCCTSLENVLYQSRKRAVSLSEMPCIDRSGN